MGWQRHDLSGVNLLGALTHLATLALQAAGTLFPARGGGGAVGEGVRGGGANHQHQDYPQGRGGRRVGGEGVWRTLLSPPSTLSTGRGSLPLPSNLTSGRGEGRRGSLPLPTHLRVGLLPRIGLVPTATQAEHQVEGRLLLDVVIREGAAILQLLAGEDETLLIWRNTLLVLR